MAYGVVGRVDRSPRAIDKLRLLQPVFGATLKGRVGDKAQPLNAGEGTIYDASEACGELGAAAFTQTMFCLLRRKPGGIAIKFLRCFEARHFAKMSDDGLFLRSYGFTGSTRLAAEITGERGFLHAAMNSGFLKSLQSGGLGMGQSGLGAAFRESPAATAASLHQKEFDAGTANPVADGSDLGASAQAPKMRQANESCRRTRIRGHSSRVHDAEAVWVESRLVRVTPCGIFLHTCAGWRIETVFFFGRQAAKRGMLGKLVLSALQSGTGNRAEIGCHVYVRADGGN